MGIHSLNGNLISTIFSFVLFSLFFPGSCTVRWWYSLISFHRYGQAMFARKCSTFELQAGNDYGPWMNEFMLIGRKKSNPNGKTFWWAAALTTATSLNAKMCSACFSSARQQRIRPAGRNTFENFLLMAKYLSSERKKKKSVSLRTCADEASLSMFVKSIRCVRAIVCTCQK